MKKSLKLLQASGFVALFALSMGSLQAEELAATDTATKTENHDAKKPKRKKEHKQHDEKGHHGNHMEKREASGKYALEQWEKSSHSLKAELAANKSATPVAASDLAKIQGDDAQLSAIYSIVVSEKSASEADRELVKTALIPLAAYANKLSSQMRELLMEIREKKFFEKDDLRAVYKSLFEGSFQDFERDYLRDHKDKHEDKNHKNKKHEDKNHKNKKHDGKDKKGKKHEDKKHKGKKHDGKNKHAEKHDDKNNDEKADHKKHDGKNKNKNKNKNKKNDSKKKHKNANKTEEHKDEQQDEAK